MPKISVIIPVYNTERYLDKCLNSCINQTFKDIEIILINDGSTDNSFEICKKYLKIDSRIRLFSQENKGQGFSRNFGIMNSKSDFIFFLDSDDYIENNTIKKLYSKVIKDKSDIVIGGWKRVDETGNSISLNPIISEDIINSSNKATYIFSGQISLISCGILFNKRLFLDNFLFFQNSAYEDVCIVPVIYYLANKISIFNENLYIWLDREDSTSNNFTLYHANGINNIYNEWLNFLLKQKEFDVINKDLHKGINKYLGFAKQKASLVTNDTKVLNYLSLLEEIFNNSKTSQSTTELQNDKKYSFSRSINAIYSHIENIKDSGEKIVIYGNGNICNIYASELSNQLVAIADINYQKLSKYADVFHPKDIHNLVFDKIFISVFGREESIIKYLTDELKIDKSKIIVFNKIL
ncbi:glycosyltransferase [Aliarcobacter cryaerophilus]|uniref:glycosyltransferase family 2 protein n=1 Tax=Aliarcobacter cryaerophilus TaxID=28198 RepID=UPI0021B2F266|nr:glycosyltransferase family 2 protein [Aliarcobacter cryaerophilus]MCT7522584.1 glycosyltransferase [Aliarcobacter cryaerophilus]